MNSPNQHDGATLRPTASFDPTHLKLAILLICAGVALLVVNDAGAKLLTDRYPPVQILVLRNLIAIPIIVGIIAAFVGVSALRTHQPGLHALRGILMVAAVWLNFTGLSYLPLAEATALIFSAPLFITALSVPLLREKVGWRRWSAVLVGFIGVLVIVRPGGATFQLASLLPVTAALMYALFMISARWIGRGESFWTMMLFVMLFPMLYAAPIALAVWTPILPGDFWLFVGIAICGSLGLALIGQAFRLAPAAIVAPFDYTALIWAAGLGWMLWGDKPVIWTLIGAIIIAISGVFLMVREASTPSGK